MQQAQPVLEVSVQVNAVIRSQTDTPAVMLISQAMKPCTKPVSLLLQGEAASAASGRTYRSVPRELQCVNACTAGFCG